MTRWLLAIHPLLFAISFVLALYSVNVAEVAPSEVWIPLTAALGFALLLLLLVLLLIGVIFKLRTTLRSSQPYQIWDIRKAAIVVSIFVVLFFTYGPVLDALGWWDHGTLWVFPFIIWVGLFICGAYFVVKTRRDLHKLTIILNIVAITLVIIPTINILVQETKTASQYTNMAENMETNNEDLANTDILPDIYYIILDRYASASTLKDVYDFDNSEFLDYLSNKGFYVANESISNYLKTPSSLASSLNMEYVNCLTEQWGEEYRDLRPIYDLLQDYTVWRLLKSVGYEFIHFGSWWEPTRKNTYADMNVNHIPIPGFSLSVLKTTIAYTFCVRLHIFGDLHTLHRNCALYSFNGLYEMPDIKGPTFVFAHILLPHPPFVFGREGNFLTTEESSKRSREVNYVDQLIATNGMVRKLLDELLSSSEVPPVIILQADEGPLPPETDFPEFKWEEASKSLLREKMRILNAYYLPNVNGDVLYPSITPVNSFRIVFNLYFDTDFELLPDKSYAFSVKYPYKFFDVTDKVKYY